MKGAIAKAEEILAEHPGAVTPDQFGNPANPEIHRRTTAEEIWADTDGKVDVIVAGVGTGGTLTGCGQALQAAQAVPADGGGRARGEPGAVRRAAGAAPDPGHRRRLRARRSWTRSQIDEIVQVSNEAAFAQARRLARLEGIPGGISSGAMVAAAITVAKRPDMAGKTIVVIIPSFAERYLSTALFEEP